MPIKINRGDLAPLADSPQNKREKQIRKSVLASTKKTLMQLLEGFSDDPVRTLLLIEEVAKSQREVLIQLGMSIEPIKDADGQGQNTWMRELMGLLREQISAQTSLAARPIVQMPAPAVPGNVPAPVLLIDSTVDVPPTTVTVWGGPKNGRCLRCRHARGAHGPNGCSAAKGRCLCSNKNTTP